MGTKNDSCLKEIHSVSMEEVLKCQNHEIGEAFVFPLKVPCYSERFMDDHKHYTKSNINVCYASPRTPGKARNWYETQLTVTKEVREKKGYPIKNIPFYVITDDGFGFLAHTTSQNNKQFAAIGDELILGKWIKGRLVDQELVMPISNISEDVNRKGMITKEMLQAYGCDSIALQKTDLKKCDPNRPKDCYDIWTLKLINIED